MKTFLNESKANAAEANAKTAAQEKKNANNDYLIYNVPFRVLEVKLFKTKSFVIPAYQVVCWGKEEEQEPMWLCGGRLCKEDNITNEEMLRRVETFIYGGLPSIFELFEEENMKNNENFLIPNDREVEFLEWRYETIVSKVFNEEKVYVGLDVWNTAEGLKYSVSGSNWLGQKTETGYSILIDEISYELMFGEKVSA